MREIKFRQWVTSPSMEKRNLGPYPYMEHNLNFHGNVNKVFANNGKQDGTMVIYYMQFIGLKDINAVDVYEGDIVEVSVDDGFDYGVRKGVVSFKDGGFYIASQSLAMYRWQGYEVRVIGNIYENPELIKGS